MYTEYAHLTLTTSISVSIINNNINNNKIYCVRVIDLQEIRMSRGFQNTSISSTKL